MLQTCKCCGQPYNIEEFDLIIRIPRIMLSHGYCFRCAFWQNRFLEDQKSKDVYNFVIEGSHYSFSKTDPIVGGTTAHRWPIMGTHKYILSKDGKLYHTNNLWHQGEIPKQFKDKFPDNAVFLTEVEYEELRSKADCTMVDNGVHQLNNAPRLEKY